MATVNSTTLSNSGTLTTQNLYTSDSVGINQSSASYTLDVSGDINATSTYKMGGVTILDSSCNLSNLATVNSTTLSNSGTVTTQNLYTSSSVGINQSSASYTLDVNGDINASSTYKMGGVTILDSGCNLSNLATVNSTTLSNSGLITTQDLTVTGTISGSILPSQVTGLLDDVSTSIITTPNLQNISSNIYTLNINSANTIVNGNQLVTGNFTASNLLVLGSATIVKSVTIANSNLVINNEAIAGSALVVNQNNTFGDIGVIADFNDTQWSADVPVFRINNAGTVGINTTSKQYTLNVNGTGYFSSNLIVNGPALTIPTGSNSQRPVNPANGMIRYNTELTTFEGYGPGDTWGSLGGVINTARTTFVKATETNTIEFKNNDVQSMIINASGNVGVGTAPTFAMDVANDINTGSTYKVKGTTVIDANSNLVNINNASVGGSLTTSNLIVNGTIQGNFTLDTNITTDKVTGLDSFVVNTKVINSSNADTVTTTVSSVAQGSITNLANVIAIGSNVSTLTIGASQTVYTGGVQINTLTTTSNLTTSNMSVFGTSIFGSDIIVNGDTHVSGTLYAAKIRLGTLYSTTTVNGTLAARLSDATQLAITKLGTVTVENLTATNTITGNISGNAATASSATISGSAGVVTFPNQPNIRTVGTLTNLTVASNITAQTLTLGGFTFNVPSTNVLNISFNGSNIAQFIA